MDAQEMDSLTCFADDFRAQHGVPSGGWVLFWLGQPFGWTARLSPEHYRPGVLAVSSDGSLILRASGGDGETGARGFSTLDEP